MSSTPVRSAPNYLTRLESLRPAYERLRAERIRAESDIERLTKEREAARRLARDAFGTDDEAEIRRLIATQEAENEAAVEAFGRLIQDLDARLARLGEEG